MSTATESLTDEAYYGELVRMLRPSYQFSRLGYHFGAKAGPTSRTMRTIRDGKHFVKKEYLGELTEKTEQEIGLLLAVTRKGLRHTASIKSVYAGTSNLTEGAAPRLELLMKNYGLDLEDWSFLLRKGQVKFWGSPYFHLAIWSHVLAAMHEFHQAKFVQVDVKSENICVALPTIVEEAADSSDRITLHFNLKNVTLIDLGEALHPDANKRALLFHPDGMALGPGNVYISPHYIKRKALVKPDDMRPLASLDWRIDFFALGCAIEEWNLSTDFPPIPPPYLSLKEKQNYAGAIHILRHLPAQLKSEDTDPSTEAHDLPHHALIRKIGIVLDLEKWESLEIILPCHIGPPHVSISAPRNSSLSAENKKGAPMDFSPVPCPARETQLEEPARRNRRKADQHNAQGPFERRATSQAAPTSKKNDSDAVKWYRMVAAQEDVPRHGIDLLC